MRKQYSIAAILSLVVMLFIVPVHMSAAVEAKTLIYDEAKLLSQQEYDRLNELANKYGAKRETDIIIITSNNPDNIDVQIMTEDFYDEKAPGYDKAHGNAVILTLDMRNRDVYLAGFYKAETYLDDGRLDKIRGKITPSLSEGDYAAAFEKYIKTSYKYMGFKPGVNPDNILFNIWFQLGAAFVIGAVAVSAMVYNSGGRVTVNRRTYEDAKASGIVDRQDQYVRTTVTKTKIEKPSSGGGGISGGGGGGISRGGHSHSGSRGKF